jgi:hypothetical protein
MDYIAKAIKNLCPESEFVIIDNNLDNIEWHVLNSEVPTKDQILTEAVIVEQQELELEAQRVAARNSALTKLAALGLTEEEIGALL